MATAVFPCEDGHAQERSLLGRGAADLGAGDTLLMDRNFCVRAFSTYQRATGLLYLSTTPRIALGSGGEERFIGRGESGAIYEQRVWSARATEMDVSTGAFASSLKKATRDGDKVLYVLTNLFKTAAPAKLIAEMYRKRWSHRNCFPGTGGPPSF